MSKLVKADGSSLEQYIGRQCRKPSGHGNTSQPKPFKSGLKVNTIKGVIIHPYIGEPAFTFVEDDSFVRCSRCLIIEE